MPISHSNVFTLRQPEMEVDNDTVQEESTQDQQKPIAPPPKAPKPKYPTSLPVEIVKRLSIHNEIKRPIGAISYKDGLYRCHSCDETTESKKLFRKHVWLHLHAVAGWRVGACTRCPRDTPNKEMNNCASFKLLMQALDAVTKHSYVGLRAMISKEIERRNGLKAAGESNQDGSRSNGSEEKAEDEFENGAARVEADQCSD